MLAVELCGVLARAARQIRPSDGADEQRIARQHEPRLGSALQIGHQQTHALRRVAGRVDDFDARVSKLDLFTVANRCEWCVVIR